MITTQSSLFTNIDQLIQSLDPQSLTEERKAFLNPLVDYIQSKVSNGDTIRLNFICTHNSRRSHVSQVWAQTMAYYFQIKNVYCYSGGTEATALFPMAAKTLQNSGFDVQTISEGTNPVYSIKYAEN
ncbi:MAG TPA: protein-tyrosine-phosphatase, partial [Saprospiraceae bacterium]|nr:protein-tyrosine-phosphatase [Saprospiraceae bacterium]